MFKTIFPDRGRRIATTLALLVAAAWTQTSPSLGNTLQNGGNPALETTEIRITGCVHNQAGVALENARVEAHDFQTGALLVSAYTNGNGVFELTGLGQGVYEMVAISGVDESHQNVLVKASDTFVEFRVGVNNAGEISALHEPVPPIRARISDYALEEA